MNIRALEISKNWLKYIHSSKPILLITGPTSSGKTTLVKTLFCDFKNVQEISGFCSTAAKEIKIVIKTAGKVKTVAEYAGFSYGYKTDALVIEDVDYLNVSGLRALSFLANKKLIPIACISTNLGQKFEQTMRNLFQHLRLFKPSKLQAVEALMQKEDIKDKRLAIGLIERHNCDIRQASIEYHMLLATRSSISADISTMDQHPQTPYDILQVLFPCRTGLFNILKYTEQEIPMLQMLVAENYLKAKNLKIEEAAQAADYISLSEIDPFFATVVVPCTLNKSLECRAVFPSIINKKVTEVQNKKRLPNGVNYETIGLIERKIVIPLLNSTLPSVITEEMKSMNITKIDQWETVRQMAAIGREPIKIPLNIKEELIKNL